MSSEMLKVIGMAELPKPTPPLTPTKAQGIREVEQGKEIAVKGAALPHEMATQQEDEDKKPFQIERAVTQMNEFVQSLNRDLQFTIDQDSGQTIIKVLDSETKEVIRQIPREELLEIANHLNEGAGVLLKVRA